VLIDKPTSGAIFLGEEFEGAGETFLFLKVAREHGLEGMVSKRVDLASRSSRRREGDRAYPARP
jgi:ATP-dependent DNA ligase